MCLDLCTNLTSDLLQMKQQRHIVILSHVFDGMHVSPITVVSVKGPPFTVRINCILLSKGL